MREVLLLFDEDDVVLWCDAAWPCDAEVDDDRVIIEFVALVVELVIELVKLIDGMLIVLLVLRWLFVEAFIILIIEFFFSLTFMFNELKSLLATDDCVANSLGLV